MRYAATFGTMGLLAWMFAMTSDWWSLRLVASWVAVSLCLAAAGYAFAGAALMGKRADGELPAWSFLLHGPFLFLGLVSMRLFHFWRARGPAPEGFRETPWDEVAPGLWIGRRPMRSDRKALRRLRPAAVIDLCAELPASRALDGTERYLALPVLDAEAPTDDQLEEGVRWIEEHLHRGPVLVHCALGHSRSATLVAAWRMMSEDLGPFEAEEELRRFRGGIWFTPRQHAALARWRERLTEARPVAVVAGS